MTKAAALMGDYIDAKFMRGLKVTRVSIDIPIEESQAFFKMFGTPDGADPVKVVIARLATSTAEQPSGPQGPATNYSGPDSQVDIGPRSPLPQTGEGQDIRRPKSRSQMAAILCTDANFQDWMFHGLVWPLGSTPADRRATTEAELKDKLAIQSKKELDTNEEAGKRWDALETEFRMRAYAR